MLILMVCFVWIWLAMEWKEQKETSSTGNWTSYYHCCDYLGYNPIDYEQNGSIHQRGRLVPSLRCRDFLLISVEARRFFSVYDCHKCINVFDILIYIHFGERRPFEPFRFCHVSAELELWLAVCSSGHRKDSGSVLFFPNLVSCKRVML